MKACLLGIGFKVLAAAMLSLPVGLRAQQHDLKLYAINDGLPSTEVYGAYQDKYGYLWVGTSNGLSRFDGRQFVNYSFSDGLPSLKVGVIFQDSRERLWIGTNAGMAQFQNNRFITHPSSDNLANTYVFAFAETKTKKLWALTQNGVYEFAGNAWKKITLYPGFENKACRNIIEADGELYVCYSTDIVYRNNKGKWLHIADRHNYHSIFNVMSVQDQQICVSTGSNIFKITNHQLVPIYKPGLNTTGYFSYMADSKNRLWIAGEHLLKVSAPGDWRHFTDSVSQLENYIFMSQDASHNIWIGTTEGLLKIKDIDFTAADKNKIASAGDIFNIIPLPDNSILLSSAGLNLYSNNSCQKIAPPKSLKSQIYYKDIVDAYTFDDANTLWMLTRLKRLLHYNGKTIEDFSSILNLKTTEHVYDINFEKKRRQFFICADSTLLFGSPQQLSVFIPRNTGVPVIKPTRILSIKNGLMLLYLDGRGVYCIDERDNLISLINETGIDGRKKGVELGVGFYEDTQNSFWITVPGLGLYEYGFNKNKRPFLKNHITTKDGLQSNDVFRVVNDRQNRLWVATNTGIDILQKNKGGSWSVFNYLKVGDLSISVIHDEKLIADGQGFIWLSSAQTLIRFNPANIRLNKEPPHIIIEKVSLAFKETDWSQLNDSLYSYYRLPGNPVLKYNQNSLGIFFNAIDLSISNSNPEYSYKLSPLDTAWSVPSKIKSVSFSQLPPGHYQFSVRAKDLASGWSRPAVFGFTITPPFWNRWWFRIIVIAVASYIIISIFRSRIRKIKNEAAIESQLKELEMKALRAQMNPHFIYNALNSIQALVADNKREEGIHYIGSFSRLLRQVLDNSENNVISLDKELESIGLYIQLESLRLDMQLQYRKDILHSIVTEFEKIPPLILQPFVENALWHGLSRKDGEKEISISVTECEGWLLCDITDNGIGRAKARELKSNSTILHQSKGLDITRKRLIDFNGDDQFPPITFSDLHDQGGQPSGTRVTVRIKRKH